MNVPELKGWDCFDHDPIEDWQPENEEVLYWLTISIGSPGAEAADNYIVPVATPAGLHLPDWKHRSRKARANPVIVSPYSWQAVHAEIVRRLTQIEGHNWNHINDQLRVEFDWEYEDYKP